MDGARPDDATPIFAEMAVPGSVFEGAWEEKTVRAAGRAQIFEAANQYAGAHARGAEAVRRLGRPGTAGPAGGRARSEARQLSIARPVAWSSIGWGGGLLSKTPWIDKDQDGEQYRQILRNVPLYRKAIDSGLPFPKTRRIVFQENKPASLPGWALLEVA